MAPGPLQNIELLLPNTLTALQLFSGGIRFVDLSGIGIPSIRRRLSVIPQQHGALDMGFSLEPRRMVLTGVIDGLDRYDADRYRDLLSLAFRPRRSPLTLRVTRDDGRIKLIDVHLNGELDFPSSERINSMQVFRVPLIAPDPIWYAETDTVLYTDEVLIEDSTQVMRVTPGLSRQTWYSYPTIRITGSMDTVISILGMLWGQAINFTSSAALPDGETWEIKITPHTATIRQLSDSANMLTLMQWYSLQRMQNFTIPPGKLYEEQAAVGRNAGIAVYSNFGANASVEVTYREKYIAL